MLPLSLQEIINATKGKLLTSTPLAQRIKGISTDTRTLKSGELFIALRGPNFDGHNFIKDALQHGASGIIISQPNFYLAKRFKKIPFIKVTDTIKALGNLARFYRSKIKATVIAITGSNGKTTTKEMIYHILSRLPVPRTGQTGHHTVLRSQKSYNNFIGVPLTLLRIRPEHKYAILELGTNQKGEIAYLAQIVRPHLGVIINISEAHLEGLGNLREVTREKSSLFQYLAPPRIAIFNADNKRLVKPMLKSAEYKIWTFGTSRSADIKGTGLKIEPPTLEFIINKRFHCVLPVMGSWNMDNALAAITVARSLGLGIKDTIRSLKTFKLPPMRMEKESIRGVMLINDAYNANPRSVTLAIDEIERIESQGQKIMVLGDMLELGQYSKRCHESIADKISNSQIDILVAVGKEVRVTIERLIKLKAKPTFFHFDSANQAGDFLKNYVRSGDLVFLKGSRRIGLEEVIARLKS